MYVDAFFFKLIYRVSAEDIRVRMKNQFSSSECFVPPPGSSSSFTIKHYNGDVSPPMTSSSLAFIPLLITGQLQYIQYIEC